MIPFELMNCPKCHKADSSVLDSRPLKNAVRRRRKCKTCQHRWTTWETSDRSDDDLAHARNLIAEFKAQMHDWIETLHA